MLLILQLITIPKLLLELEPSFGCFCFFRVQLLDSKIRLEQWLRVLVKIVGLLELLPDAAFLLPHEVVCLACGCQHSTQLLGLVVDSEVELLAVLRSEFVNNIGGVILGRE